jgi:peptidoglycan hydrolase-like protein with peptidoglycan-binding domain
LKNIDKYILNEIKKSFDKGPVNEVIPPHIASLAAQDAAATAGATGAGATKAAATATRWGWVGGGVAAAVVAGYYINSYGNKANLGELEFATYIGTPKYFKDVNKEIPYNMLLKRTKKWYYDNQGGPGWPEHRGMAREFYEHILRKPEFWQKVHEKEKWVQDKVNGRDDSFWTAEALRKMIRGAYGGNPDRLTDPVSGVVYKPNPFRLEYLKTVIRDEYTAMAEKLDDDIPRMGKWDGAAWGSEEEDFADNYLLSLANMYDEWLNDAVKRTSKRIPAATATAAANQAAANQAAAADEEDQGPTMSDPDDQGPPMPDADQGPPAAPARPRISKTQKQKNLLSGIMDLEALQAMLLSHGFWGSKAANAAGSTKTFSKDGDGSIVADGKYGDETEEAITNLQKALNKKDAGISVDGWYGKKTHAALVKNPNVRGSNFEKGKSPVSIKHISAKLDKKTGDYIGTAKLSTGGEISTRHKRSGQDDTGDIRMSTSAAKDKAKAHISSLKEIQEIIKQEVRNTLMERKSI